MRYEATTALSPLAAIAYAKNHFGLQGVGLGVIDEHDTSVTLMEAAAMCRLLPVVVRSRPPWN